MDKILWNTLTIQVPREMVAYMPQGKVSIKKTLTKLHGISRTAKQPSIKLVQSPDNQIHVMNQCKVWNVDALKETLKKSNTLAERNVGKVLSMGTHKKAFDQNMKRRATSLVDARLGIDPSVKGYSWDISKIKWKARIKINQRFIHFGFFDNEDDARQAYLVSK